MKKAHQKFFYLCYRHWTLLLAGLAIIVCGPHVYAETQSKITASERLSGRSMGPLVEIFEDKEALLTIDQVADPAALLPWKKSSVDNPSFGFTKAAIWLRFKFDPAGWKKATWMVSVSYPPLDDVALYSPTEQGYTASVTGDRYAFDARELLTHSYAFLLNSGQGSERYYYMRIKADGAVVVPIKIWMLKDFIVNQTGELIIYGMYFGIAVSMLLYNLGILIAFREKIYLYYVVYIASNCIYQLSIDGLTQRFAWPDLPFINNYAVPFFLMLGSLSLTLFSISLLQIKRYFSRFYGVVKGLAVVCVIGIVLTFVASYSVSIKVATFTGVSLCVILMIASIGCYFNGNKAARFYIIAFSWFLVGIFLFGLKTIGFIPHNVLTHNASQIGSALEMILLSLALGDRVRFRNEFNHAQILNLNEELTQRSDEIEKEYHDKTRAIKKIIENVKSSFVMVDENLNVMEGFSLSCRDMFPHIKAKMPFVELLGLQEKEQLDLCDILTAMLDKEASHPASFSKFVKRYTVGERIIDVQPALVRYADSDEVNFLFTFTDATYAIELEQAAAKNSRIVKVLSDFGWFCGVMGHVRKEMQRLRALPKPDPMEAEALLGAFECYLAVYKIEAFTPALEQIKRGGIPLHSALENLELVMQKFAKENELFFDVKNNQDMEALFHVYDRDLNDLVASDKNSSQVQRWIMSRIELPVSHYFGFLEEVALQQAKAHHKKVILTYDSKQLLKYGPAFETLSLNLINLLDFLIQFSVPDHGGMIKLNITTNLNTHVFKLQDDGGGLDLTSLSRIALEKRLLSPSDMALISSRDMCSLIFDEQFSRLSRQEMRGFPGLGLYSVKKVLEQWGGMIRVESTSSLGTVFTIVVPKGERLTEKAA
jgi:hypothetical protein